MHNLNDLCSSLGDIPIELNTNQPNLVINSHLFPILSDLVSWDSSWDLVEGKDYYLLLVNISTMNIYQIEITNDPIKESYSDKGLDSYLKYLYDNLTRKYIRKISDSEYQLHETYLSRILDYSEHLDLNIEVINNILVVSDQNGSLSFEFLDYDFDSVDISHIIEFRRSYEKVN